MKIRIDRQILADRVSLRDHIAMKRGDLESIVNVLGNFVVGDNGTLLPHDEGKEKVLDLTPNQLAEVMQAYQASAESAIVPPTKPVV